MVSIKLFYKCNLVIFFTSLLLVVSVKFVLIDSRITER